MEGTLKNFVCAHMYVSPCSEDDLQRQTEYFYPNIHYTDHDAAGTHQLLTSPAINQ